MEVGTIIPKIPGVNKPLKWWEASFLHEAIHKMNEAKMLDSPKFFWWCYLQKPGLNESTASDSNWHKLAPRCQSSKGKPLPLPFLIVAGCWVLAQSDKQTLIIFAPFTLAGSNKPTLEACFKTAWNSQSWTESWATIVRDPKSRPYVSNMIWAVLSTHPQSMSHWGTIIPNRVETCLHHQLAVESRS